MRYPLSLKIFGFYPTHILQTVCVVKAFCFFRLTDMKEGQSGPERESKEPKQKAVDRSEASWPQQPPRLTAPVALKS